MRVRTGLPQRKVTRRRRKGYQLGANHHEQDGPLVFQHACKIGLEGIVSKRRDSRYRSGRSPDWIKSKNPNAPVGSKYGHEGLVFAHRSEHCAEDRD
jgi:ATP-dependent DNA ligase